MKYNLINAIAYELCLSVIAVRPALRDNVWIQRLLSHCFSDWVEWKTERTIVNVNKQIESIKVDWQKEDNKKVVEDFQKVNPEAKVTTHNSQTGAVLIEHPPDGSQAQDLLGGTIEIRSPWSLQDKE